MTIASNWKLTVKISKEAVHAAFITSVDGPKYYGIKQGRLGGNMGPYPVQPKEIDGLFVPPGKAYGLTI